MMDELIDRNSVQDPFLDAGCGIGDVAAHLARRGWSGLAVDSSPAAIEIAKRNLASTSVCAEVGELFDLRGEFRSIILSTVIEHVRDDAALLKHLRTLYRRDASPGHLLISMPMNPNVEWRWDDDYYGHFRRYTRPGVEVLLSSCGFHLISLWDYTFPVFWAMRRVYTAIRAPKALVSDVPEESTRMSAVQSAWDMGTLTRLIAAAPIWPIVYSLQKNFREGERGFEAFALAETV